jgi:hypothetical protein
LIYRFGQLPDDASLRGYRESGLAIEGADAACVNCHRRSGLGSIEGRSTVPPITGQFLFHRLATNVDDLDLPVVESARGNRNPYTEETLARAIREGVDVNGRPLSYLMPRYTLDDASMAALSSYLRSLTRIREPGVTDAVLHFATIITPDADPAQRAGMLAVLEDYFAEKNATARAVAPPVRSYRNMMFRATRRWQLHVWELEGPADGWETQLQRHLESEPVFAVISGLGGRNWEPVHRFCERAALPCLFPNVQLPVVAEGDFHSLYFSRGVLLEARLVATRLQQLDSAPGTRRVIQLYRADDIGAAAARTLRGVASGSGIELIDRPLRGGRPATALAGALRDVGPTDVLVLWLRGADLAQLPAAPPAAGAVLASGLMGGLDNAPLSPAWRDVARMTYPFDLPERRRARVNYPLGWFALRHVPITDLQVQSDTYLACGLVSETLNHLSGTYIRDYLIERIEGMLEHRVITGYYPRLSLAPGQRFASKGGYFVRFAQVTGTRVVADGDWIVPPY